MRSFSLVEGAWPVVTITQPNLEIRGCLPIGQVPPPNIGQANAPTGPFYGCAADAKAPTGGPKKCQVPVLPTQNWALIRGPQFAISPGQVPGLIAIVHFRPLPLSWRLVPPLATRVPSADEPFGAAPARRTDACLRVENPFGPNMRSLGRFLESLRAARTALSWFQAVVAKCAKFATFGNHTQSPNRQIWPLWSVTMATWCQSLKFRGFRRSWASPFPPGRASR